MLLVLRLASNLLQLLQTVMWLMIKLCANAGGHLVVFLCRRTALFFFHLPNARGHLVPFLQSRRVQLSWVQRPIKFHLYQKISGAWMRSWWKDFVSLILAFWVSWVLHLESCLRICSPRPIPARAVLQKYQVLVLALELGVFRSTGISLFPTPERILLRLPSVIDNHLQANACARGESSK
jgi:hypothetical protein